MMWTEADPVFGLHIPKSVPDVPDEVLEPAVTVVRTAAYDDCRPASWPACSATTSRSSRTA
jgi:ATP-dependent phosphoenolpyruvate carboxykinase